MSDAKEIDKRRRFEWKKYDDLYAKRVEAKPGIPYGVANHGSAAIPILLENYKAKSICDVGTGSGMFCVQARYLGLKDVIGVDFASRPQYPRIEWIYAPAHDIPLPDNRVEWVTAFDLLEHLLPEEVDDVLKEFSRIASKGMAFSIAYVGSHKVHGSDLHQTIQPKVWWLHKLKEYGTVREWLRPIRKIIKDYQFVEFP